MGLKQRSIFLSEEQLAFLKKHKENTTEGKGALLRRLLNKYIEEMEEKKNG